MQNGYPVAWSEVSPGLKNKRCKEDLVKRWDMKEDR